MKDKNIALPEKAARYFYTERIVSGGLTAFSGENKRRNTYVFRLLFNYHPPTHILRPQYRD